MKSPGRPTADRSGEYEDPDMPKELETKIRDIEQFESGVADLFTSIKKLTSHYSRIGNEEAVKKVADLKKELANYAKEYRAGTAQTALGDFYNHFNETVKKISIESQAPAKSAEKPEPEVEEKTEEQKLEPLETPTEAANGELERQLKPLTSLRELVQTRMGRIPAGDKNLAEVFAEYSELENQLAIYIDLQTGAGTEGARKKSYKKTPDEFLNMASEKFSAISKEQKRLVSEALKQSAKIELKDLKPEPEPSSEETPAPVPPVEKPAEAVIESKPEVLPTKKVAPAKVEPSKGDRLKKEIASMKKAAEEQRQKHEALMRETDDVLAKATIQQKESAGVIEAAEKAEVKSQIEQLKKEIKEISRDPEKFAADQARAEGNKYRIDELNPDKLVTEREEAIYKLEKTLNPEKSTGVVEVKPKLATEPPPLPWEPGGSGDYPPPLPSEKPKAEEGAFTKFFKNIWQAAPPKKYESKHGVGDTVIYIDHKGNKVTGKITSKAGALGYRVKKSGLVAKLFGSDEFIDPQRVVGITKKAEPEARPAANRHQTILPRKTSGEKIVAEGYDSNMNMVRIEIPKHPDDYKVGDRVKLGSDDQGWRLAGHDENKLLYTLEKGRGKNRALKLIDRKDLEKIYEQQKAEAA